MAAANGQRPKLAVFISGRGTGLQSLVDAIRKNELHAEIALVVSSSLTAYGLERARNAEIATSVFDQKSSTMSADQIHSVMRTLKSSLIDYIALAGYLKFLPSEVIAEYPGRIVNIHPALLPKFGGKGMYGMKVHEAVIAAGEKESGATVHLVDELYDHGKILEQERVPVLPDDTPALLAGRVLAAEHRLYPRALEKLITGKYA